VSEEAVSRVRLPGDVRPPFEVYVNGVLQEEGRDYVVEGRTLRFSRRLVPPRRDTLWSVARGLLYGRYRTEHTVDVAYEVAGRRLVASGLAIEDERAAPVSSEAHLDPGPAPHRPSRG
jgi:hypothetical protein